jgi:iodotyrosine deiodinase
MTANITKEYKPIPLPNYVELPVEEMRHRAKAFYELIRKQHSVRDFSSKKVPRDIIEQCILAAGTAPSGANHQPWHFCVIGDSKKKKLIRDAAENEEHAFYSGEQVESG